MLCIRCKLQFSYHFQFLFNGLKTSMPERHFNDEKLAFMFIVIVFDSTVFIVFHVSHHGSMFGGRRPVVIRIFYILLRHFFFKVYSSQCIYTWGNIRLSNGQVNSKQIFVFDPRQPKFLAHRKLRTSPSCPRITRHWRKTVNQFTVEKTRTALIWSRLLQIS